MIDYEKIQKSFMMLWEVFWEVDEYDLQHNLDRQW